MYFVKEQINVFFIERNITGYTDMYFFNIEHIALRQIFKLTVAGSSSISDVWSRSKLVDMLLEFNILDANKTKYVAALLGRTWVGVCKIVGFSQCYASCWMTSRLLNNVIRWIMHIKCYCKRLNLRGLRKIPRVWF